jgi:hypothetical protein
MCWCEINISVHIFISIHTAKYVRNWHVKIIRERFRNILQFVYEYILVKVLDTLQLQYNGEFDFEACKSLTDGVCMIACADGLRVSTRWVQIPVAARSEAWVIGRALAGIVGSNLTGGVDVCVL